MIEKGILVAADANIEWLLAWWWERYSSCNTLPVVFVDFGMTPESLAWCREKGEVIPFDKPSFCKPLSKEAGIEAEQIYGKSCFQARNAWFKKPSACLLSPFSKTLWLDLDCEVLSSLDSVFLFLEHGRELAVNYGYAENLPKVLEKASAVGTVCNSGVFLFSKGSQLLQKWEKIALEESDRYLGDECILSTLLAESLETVSFLPEEYNWRMCRGVPVNAKIIHWKGEWGKKYILKHGGLKNLLPACFL